MQWLFTVLAQWEQPASTAGVDRRISSARFQSLAACSQAASTHVERGGQGGPSPWPCLSRTRQPYLLHVKVARTQVPQQAASKQIPVRGAGRLSTGLRMLRFPCLGRTRRPWQSAAARARSACPSALATAAAPSPAAGSRPAPAHNATPWQALLAVSTPENALDQCGGANARTCGGGSRASRWSRMACTAACSRSVSVGTIPGVHRRSATRGRSCGIREHCRQCGRVGQQSGATDLLPEAYG